MAESRLYKIAHCNPLVICQNGVHYRTPSSKRQRVIRMKEAKWKCSPLGPWGFFYLAEAGLEYFSQAQQGEL
jgi:hypothetical protein